MSIRSLPALLLPLLLTAPALAQSGAPGPLFSPVSPQAAASASGAVPTPPAALRVRAVAVDFAALYTSEGAPRGSGIYALELFPGTTVTLDVERWEAAYGGGVVWHGTVEGHSDSSVVLSRFEDALSATVRWGTRYAQVGYAGAGTHLVYEIDESAMPECGTGVAQAVPGAVPHGGGGTRGSGSGGAAPRAGNPDIDVLVAYTTAAKNASGGASGIASRINLAVSETNAGYQASGVSQQLVLVHTEEMIGYSESSFGTMLSDLRGTNDGKMDQVHALRDQYAADCVALICENGQYCGMAYLMTNPGPGFATSAFSVTNYSCATGYYSFGHELGHNFGCAHDPGNAGSAAYSYSYGYRTPNSAYRTVLAYSPGTRVNRYSGPGVQYSSYTMGTANQDNARSLDNTSQYTSAWRVGGPTTPVFVQPLLVAGLTGFLNVEECTPAGTVWLAFSAAGGGPTATVFGTAALSDPVQPIGPQVADGVGKVQYFQLIPAAASGSTLWLQAYDVGKQLFSNGVQTTVQ